VLSAVRRPGIVSFDGRRFTRWKVHSWSNWAGFAFFKILLFQKLTKSKISVCRLATSFEFPFSPPPPPALPPELMVLMIVLVGVMMAEVEEAVMVGTWAEPIFPTLEDVDGSRSIFSIW